jgi:hypothetical protein
LGRRGCCHGVATRDASAPAPPFCAVCSIFPRRSPVLV